jgi:hypothetical protein
LPPKPTIPPIRQRIRGPFARYPVVNGPVSKLALKPTVPARPLVRQKIVGLVSRYPAVNERISTPTLNAVSCVEAELAEVRNAWATYRSTNSRDAIYIYLTAVFRVVMRWQRLDCALKNARAALRLQPNPPQMKPEPFGIMIFCTTDPDVVDPKTRSKWSRVLRYAARAKPASQRLTDFVKSNGGINECARKFARTARSASK